MRVNGQSHRAKAACYQRLVLAATIAALTGCAAPRLPTKQPTTEVKSLHEQPGQKPRTLSPIALQAEVMRFADQ